ncbi:hypothetical protein [Parasediminibacterium sp. JCM 36343]|uniref:hypothetical protein n=1 Tax=Parasediminibacterium sp. JCM 36343 TaxID=3374279 RepID=UPI00397B1F70
MPAVLFHYTSINNLALILNSKSIRFGRLDKVNDPTEGQSEDFKTLAPYIFISCWTENAEENLPFWNMYTPQMRGVRIELPLPIFNSYKIGQNYNLLVSEEEYDDNINNFFIFPGKNEPDRIEYTDNIDKLKPKIITEKGLRIRDLALHKRGIWEIEQEFRYRLDIFPTDPKVQSLNFLDKYDHLIGIQNPSIEGYLISIQENSFNNMKIRLSPKIISGDYEIITALLDKFNPNAVLEKSVLTGLIR